MKRLVIVFLFLLALPICFGKTVGVLGVGGGEDAQIVSEGATYYAVLNDKVVADVGDSVVYYHKDRIGSNIRTTREEVEQSKTLPFGKSLQNDGIRFTFTGKELDSSGLYYYGARYYDYDLGRFMSTDPVVDGHPYVYTRNNPLKFTDPTGMRVYFADEEATNTYEPLAKGMDVYQRLSNKLNYHVQVFGNEDSNIPERAGGVFLSGGLPYERKSLWGRTLQNFMNGIKYGRWGVNPPAVVMPSSSLAEEKHMDTRSKESGLYHEFVHAETDYEQVSGHYSESMNQFLNFNTRWNQENDYIGGEVIAHYNTARYEYENYGVVSRGTLSNYFSYRAAVDYYFTPDNGGNKEVSSLLSLYDQSIEHMAGHTSDSFSRTGSNYGLDKEGNVEATITIELNR